MRLADPWKNESESLTRKPWPIRGARSLISEVWRRYSYGRKGTLAFVTVEAASRSKRGPQAAPVWASSP